ADLGRTWPAWLLVVGIVTLLQSTASSQGHIGPLPPGPPPATPPQTPPPTSTDPSSGEVRNAYPRHPHDTRNSATTPPAPTFFCRPVGAHHLRRRFPARQPAHADLADPGHRVCP